MCRNWRNGFLDCLCGWGRTNSISGLKSALDQPEFATAIGLVKFGCFEQQKQWQQRGRLTGLKNRFTQPFGGI